MWLEFFKIVHSGWFGFIPFKCDGLILMVQLFTEINVYGGIGRRFRHWWNYRWQAPYCSANPQIMAEMWAVHRDPLPTLHGRAILFIFIYSYAHALPNEAAEDWWRHLANNVYKSRFYYAKWTYWHSDLDLWPFNLKAYHFEYIHRSSPIPSLNTLRSFFFELCCGQTNRQTDVLEHPIPTPTDIVGVDRPRLMIGLG